MSGHFREDITVVDGRSYRVRYIYDEDHDAPWEDGDGRGIVICSNDRADKKPGWRLLHSDRGDAWWFDWAGTIKKAETEGWGAGEEVERAMRLAGATTRQIRERAVQNEFDLFRAYLRDAWYYVGIEVTAIVEGELDETLQDTCWGFETWKDYHLEAAADMVAQLDDQVVKELAARASREERDATVRRQARRAFCMDNLVVPDGAAVTENETGYWVAALVHVPKEQ